jgi:hypothetical protein
MLNLIRKDFIAGWMFLIGVVLIIPFISMIAMWAMMDDFGGVIIGVFTFIVIILCIASSFIFLGVDTTYKAEMIYASLPIKRSKIVLAHYLSSFMLTTGSFSLAVLSCFSMVYIFNHIDPAFDIILSLRGIIAMLSFLFMILSFIFPFIFKFGAGKGIMAALITQISLMIAVPVIKFVLKALQGILAFDFAFFNRMLHSAIKWLVGLTTFHAYVLIFGIVSFVILVSIGLSVRFYKKMDL